MPKARLTYDGDGDYIEKDRRVLQLTQEIQDKVDAIPWVVDDLTETSSTDALSANMGRVLQEQINELSALWHFLSGWNASTWLPATNPRVDPYYYKTWDYYRVTAIWETNYKPHWWIYNQWVASTAVELDDVSIWDWYMYDGWVRMLIKQWWSWWGGAYFKTQNEYDALPQSKESDNNLYIIVDSHIDLLTPPELYALWVAAGNSDDAIIAELNTHPAEYLEFAISNWWGQKSDFPWVPAWKTLYTWEVWILDDPNGWGVYATLVTDMEENEFITFMLNNVPWATQEVVEQLWEKRSTYTMKRSAFPK